MRSRLCVHTRHLALAVAAENAAAIASAKSATPAWRLATLEKQQGVLFNVRERA